MSYRDELAAALARIADLERSFAEVSRERDRLGAECDRLRHAGGSARTGEQRHVPPAVASERLSASVYCKACGGKNDAGQSLCVHCDEPLNGVAKEAEGRCPVCKDRFLEPVSLGAISELQSCRRCGGIWVPVSSLASLLEAAGRRILGFEPHELDMLWDGVSARGRVSYVACPVCGQTMLRRAHGSSNVVLDVCMAHGLWCDHGELPKLLKAAAQGETENPLVRSEVDLAGTAGFLGRDEEETVLDWLASFLR